MATKPPEKKPVEPPKEQEESISYYHVLGFSSYRAYSHLWAGDGNVPFCYGSTAGNMYLDAAGNCQVNATDQHHKVTVANHQFYGSVDRKVKSKETVLIGGDNKIQIDGTQSVNIVGDHTLNVKGSQTTTAFGGQAVKVAAKGRKLTVASGDYNRKVKGNHTLTANANDKTEVFNIANITNMGVNLTSIMGDYFILKASRETDITFSEKINIGGSTELGITVGESIKAAAAASLEQVVGMKLTIKAATGSIITGGITKETDLQHVLTATVEDLQTAINDEYSEIEENNAGISKTSGPTSHS